MFTGSYVALVTPMLENGDIDYKSLEKLVKFHVEQGTHGIVSVGTTGESATLPFDEHVNVVKETVAMASGAIPVIAGSGANSTAEAIFLTEQLGSFISNPDLVERLTKDAPLNALDPETLYGGGEKGYTDYPTLAESSVAAQ